MTRAADADATRAVAGPAPRSSARLRPRAVTRMQVETSQRQWFRFQNRFLAGPTGLKRYEARSGSVGNREAIGAAMTAA